MVKELVKAEQFFEVEKNGTIHRIEPGQVWVSGNSYRKEYAFTITALRIKSGTYDSGGEYAYKEADVLYWHSDGQWRQNRNYTSKRINDEFLHYYKLFGTVEEYEQNHRWAMDMLAGKPAPFSMDTSKESSPDDMALIGAGSKQLLELHKQSLEVLTTKAGKLKAAMEIEIEARKRSLEAIRDGMHDAIETFKKQMAKVQRVIDTIELYLGIYEDIVQIAEGKPAGAETPVTFRQQLIFMDEELAIDRYDADQSDIAFFDTWLFENERWKKYVPEEKCLVAFKPRRYKKNYTEDTFLNSILNQDNFLSYLLIRNGDNLYRIWSGLNVRERLFPLQSEIQGIFEKMQATFESDRDKAERELHSYQRIAFVLQGLIDRTQVFQPIPPGIKIFEMDKWEHLVKFIYDDEDALHDGKMRFRQWQQKINAGIGQGSRVAVISGGNKKNYRDRLAHYYGEYNIPDFPGLGIYTVEQDRKKQVSRSYYSRRTDGGDGYYILYNPGDTVYGSWGDYDPHTRKKRLSFVILPDEDDFIINYDLCSLEDVNYFLESRFERREYAHIIPSLLALQEQLQKELEWEKHFVRLTVDQVQQELNITQPAKIEAVVWEVLRWWKIEKVKWRRPITKDDAKALRMIKAEAKRRFKNG